MTGVVDVLVEAGAAVHGIEEAAAAGDITGWLMPETALDARIRALVMAADHERLGVIDALLAAGVDVDAVDPVWGGQPLRAAATTGKAAGVRHLLARGADPTRRDDRGRTALDLCRQHRPPGGSPGFDQVEALLAPLTPEGAV